jgi:hypothetical protein
VHVPTAPGKVLAISPDGKKIIVSDTLETPNQVFIVDVTASTPAITPLLITGATAADFSPDSFKAFILAGNVLYVLSPLDALKKINLAGAANDVSFLSDGAFAYLAGGTATSGVSTLKTCDNTPALDVNGMSQDIGLPVAPTFLKTMPDSTSVVGVNTSGIDLIDVTTIPIGCAPPGPPPLQGGLPTVTNAHPSSNSFNFGQGTFTPTQLIVSTDGRHAYILGEGLNNIIVFNFDSRTTSGLQLAGGAIPLRASLTTDGKTLYVAGNDGTVHVVDTVNAVDTTQISFPQGLCHRKTNTVGDTFSCDIDLIAVKP